MSGYSIFHIMFLVKLIRYVFILFVKCCKLIYYAFRMILDE